MNYGNITDDALNVIVEDDYEKGELTLKDVLDDYNEDIIYADFKVSSEGDKLRRFTAWSQDSVFLLIVDGLFSQVLQIPRNPPNVSKP